MGDALMRLPWILSIGLVMSLPFSGVAHRLDEYLQATLVSIEPGAVRLHINFTPGVEVAEQVLANIDRDHDGVISTNEATAYAKEVMRDLVLRLDGKKLALQPISSTWPELSELRSGWGIIQMEFSAAPGSLTLGAHKLTLKNRHLPKLSVYLFNAAQPAPGPVHITRQTRNDNQSTGEIEFTISQTDAKR